MQWRHDSLSITSLQVDNWTEDASISQVFRILACHKEIYIQYLMNYPQADLALEKCLKSNPDLLTVTSRLIIQNQTTPYSLSHLLHKPIVRIQNREDLPSRLLENTPTDHPGSKLNYYHIIIIILTSGEVSLYYFVPNL